MTAGPIVVVGDSLLDVDIEGDAERLCPDAPVPVVCGRAEHRRPGGAGLAALLAAREGAEVVLITALGEDAPGRGLRALLSGFAEVVRLPLRGTTSRKTRVRARDQTLLRIDTGDGRAWRGPEGNRAARALRGAGAVLVADYGRGTAETVRDLLNRPAVPLVWDPHPAGSIPVPGCALVTPSLVEAAVLCGQADPQGAGSERPGATPEAAARHLARALHAEAVAVTLGGRGAVLCDGNGRTTRVPPPARVLGRDSCGAGDRFASAAALALRDGAPAAEAVAAAVRAATRFVEAGGAAGIRLPEAPAADRPRTAIELAALVRATGGRLIATGGCFDLLHAGHVRLLRQARALGDALIVCVNADESVRRLKGPGRPVVPEEDRMEVLRALGCVDAVVLFAEDTPTRLIEHLRPDVWVKGGDYTGLDLPEAEAVRRTGGEVVVLPTFSGHSTTGLIAAVQEVR
ncbi:bifunctional protein HldE [Sphaerisporangium siamense]|uniref:D-glycero-beta-D-manno-heptose 1-phosphate adenylyltransferase n=1 Tax=Sphaerisporangium siamense TaxID=795645 RepID=A0A7W7G9M3_9ACTN|nr:D-glycero-beta-D-manno-heptose 1-phosphate adenylyltransferase [Sphaerisporangium siamense]MBB4699146.1 rfaE bifunctional protein nucleotidyltransferase chain/domain/rfaE bifunctional protein kinase chain/domain [Sphaerisporangium siamense]GII86727.1 bifunctional protein HldE [Sphaerisporangium siamense]